MSLRSIDFSVIEVTHLKMMCLLRNNKQNKSEAYDLFCLSMKLCFW